MPLSHSFNPALTLHSTSCAALSTPPPATFSRSPLCSPPKLRWLHRGSTRSTPDQLAGRPTTGRRTGSGAIRPGQRPPCTGRPSSKPPAPEGGHDHKRGDRESDSERRGCRLEAVHQGNCGRENDVSDQAVQGEAHELGRATLSPSHRAAFLT